MQEKPFDKVWGWATVVFVIAAIGLVVGVVFKLMLFVFPENWTIWYGLCKILYFVGIWQSFLYSLPQVSDIFSLRGSTRAPLFISFRNAMRCFCRAPSE